MNGNIQMKLALFFQNSIYKSQTIITQTYIISAYD